MTEIVETKEGILREQVQEVYIQRKEFATLEAIIKESNEQWKRNNRQLLDNYREAEIRKTKAEQDLRDSAITFYRETKNKAPVPGVEVKIYQVLSYDPKQALNWAMEKKMALKLNKKLFEHLAITVEDIPFVEIKEEPRATIATDLGKALSQKEKI